MRTCGEFGYTTKSGKPCGYRIGDDKKSCPHHDPDDPDRKVSREFQALGVSVSKAKQLPADIDLSSLDSAADLFRLFASVARSAARDKHPDLKRLDVLLRAGNAANAVQQTQAIKELNETVLRTEGHGPALVLLERIRKGGSRPLPGLKLVAPLDGPASDGSEPA